MTVSSIMRASFLPVLTLVTLVAFATHTMRPFRRSAGAGNHRHRYSWSAGPYGRLPRRYLFEKLIHCLYIGRKLVRAPINTRPSRNGSFVEGHRVSNLSALSAFSRTRLPAFKVQFFLPLINLFIMTRLRPLNTSTVN